VQLYFFEIIYEKSVAPAKAGVQFLGALWIPAFAGMTFPEVLVIKLRSTAKKIKSNRTLLKLQVPQRLVHFVRNDKHRGF